jgi:hypothetical protein
MDSFEFEQGKKKILFFSRGRGRGHAIVDIEIAKEIAKLSGDVDLRFVSYGTGAATLRTYGISHIDLKLPDRSPINETIVLAGRLIGCLNPDLVVAHEEFPALPAAKIFHRPTVFLTDWFTDPDALSMGALRLADRILFLDEPGVYQEVTWAAGKTHYLGPVLRKFQYGAGDRSRARVELGLPENALVLAVLPGSWRETDLPILEPVLGMFDLLDREPRYLLWAAGTDENFVREGTLGRGNVTVFGYDPAIDRVMIAADAAITKGNRKTLMELHHLGRASVSISNGDNPIDHFRACRLPYNSMVAGGVTSGELLIEVLAALDRPVEPRAVPDAAVKCARLILMHADSASRER